MVYRKTKYANVAITLLILVLVSNFLLYQSSVQNFLSIPLTSGVAIGSLIDLAIVAPLLMFAAFKISIKQTIGLVLGGLVIARFYIPAELFAPYRGILYAGLSLEALLLLGELSLIFLVIWKVPKIRKAMKSDNENFFYSLLPTVERVVTKHMIVRLFVSEFLMMYYALFTWKKNSPNHEGVVTMHKKTSAIAMNIMLIHAVVIETIGLHWWLHEKSMVLSIVLLILNIYTVIFFIAEIQVTRLQPLEIKNNQLYVTQGLSARIIVPLENIKEVEWGAAVPSKDTLQFVYRDFEEVLPQAIVHLKEPIEATMLMGMKKSVTEFALLVDEPERLKELLETPVTPQ